MICRIMRAQRAYEEPVRHDSDGLLVLSSAYLACPISETWVYCTSEVSACQQGAARLTQTSPGC